ncbi:MAG TPA: MBL fold metallo-hydrolase [Gammaproteobacteria bacterium]|nr:MBL fold metallo-hydrolase [Gammaproteobacteria bacterium]
MSRRRFLRASLGAGAAAFGASLLPPVRSHAQPAGPAIKSSDLGGVSLLQGAGSNVLALHGDEGALVVDGGLVANADALMRAIQSVTGNDRVRLLINTHWHPEQVGLNLAVGTAGGEILAHEKTRMYLGSRVYAMDDKRRFAPVAPLPEKARPNTSVRGEGSLEFGGRRVDYGYLPAAHTDGDLFVHFPQLNVLAVGGVLAADRWPLLEYRDGAWLGGRVRAVERLAGMVKPDTRVVPAQGPVLSGRDVVRQRGIYDALFETMIGYMNKGFGAEDAVRTNPLKAYEAEFGDPSAFLDGAYRSMLIAYVPE